MFNLSNSVWPARMMVDVQIGCLLWGGRVMVGEGGGVQRFPISEAVAVQRRIVAGYCGHIWSQIYSDFFGSTRNGFHSAHFLESYHWNWQDHLCDRVRGKTVGVRVGIWSFNQLLEVSFDIVWNSHWQISNYAHKGPYRVIAYIAMQWLCEICIIL